MMAEAVEQRELNLQLSNPCPCCEGQCGFYVRVVYLFYGVFNEWRWCRMCKATGSVSETKGGTTNVES